MSVVSETFPRVVTSVAEDVTEPYMMILIVLLLLRLCLLFRRRLARNGISNERRVSPHFWSWNDV